MYVEFCGGRFFLALLLILSIIVNFLGCGLFTKLIFNVII